MSTCFFVRFRFFIQFPSYTVEPDLIAMANNSGEKLSLAAIAEIQCRHASYNIYRSCLLIYGIAIVRSLSFLFLVDFKGNANINIADRKSVV